MIKEQENNKGMMKDSEETKNLNSHDNSNSGNSDNSDMNLVDKKNNQIKSGLPTESKQTGKNARSNFKSPFIIGKKIGMTRLFDENGRDFPVTVIEAGPCFLTQIKTLENDGYTSLQIGFGLVGKNKLNKAKIGHLNKSKVKPLRHLCEFRSELDVKETDLGSEIDVSIFDLGDFVSVVGVSKGRGFSGHMKRHNFGGGRRSHGKNSVMRKAGSIGAGSDPSRVWPGTRMAGRFGNDTKTIKNLEIVKINIDENLLFVHGSVPGAKNGIVYLKKHI